MNHVLVRYSSIGTKSRPVRRRMRDILRQRVVDRLEYEGIEYEKVSAGHGRIIVETSEAVNAAKNISELPGIASASPATKTDADLESIKGASEKFEYGDTFGVDANRTGKHEFSSQDVKVEVGSHVEEFTGANVDLDNPDTLLEADIREEDAYLFTERFEGPGGLPVGAQESFVALISGGIDSPVAAYQMLKRGADITPVYFYNKPIAAEDHLMRFQLALEKLRRFHPGKRWDYYVVDMEEVNERLTDVEKGRMVLQRIVMFRTAEMLAENEGLRGIVTGESLGQKSSQTAFNLGVTSSEIDKPIMRPLLTWNKNEIVSRAKELGTFEEAKISSACSTMAPDKPATKVSESNLKDLKQEIDVGELVDLAVDDAEKHVLRDRKG